MTLADHKRHFERENLITANQSKDELSELLSTFDNENIEILNDIIGGFQFASEYNIKDTNAKLKKFGQNMHWDLEFMLRIVSLDFESLEKTNVSNKRKLIESIEALIKEYSSLPDSHNLMEIY